MTHRPLRAAFLALAIVGCAETVTGGTAPTLRCTFPGGRECPAGMACATDDGCNTCTCMTDGSLACTPRACVDGGAVQDLPPTVEDAPDATRVGAGGPCLLSDDCSPGLTCVLNDGCARDGRCADTTGCAMRPATTTYCGCDRRTFEALNACPPRGPYIRVGPCPPGIDWDDPPPDAAGPPPDAAGPPPDAAGATSRYAQATFTWGWEGDIGGRDAVTVTGDGAVRLTLETGAPTRHLATAVTDDLFARWERVSLTGLPHAPGGRLFCFPGVTVRLCARCETVYLRYSLLPQILPEMNEVLAWFAAHLPERDPATFCASRSP